MTKDHQTIRVVRFRLREARLQRHWSQRDLADHLGTTRLTISRWEKGATSPSIYFRSRLTGLFGMSEEELGLVQENVSLSTTTAREIAGAMQTSSSPADVHTLWTVPYPRNPHFTGRAELLHTLHEQLNRECSMALTQSWAISGLGGIGKTQIALEYAYQYRQDYRYVFWTSAASHETLLAGFVNIADLLQLPAKDEQDQKKVFTAVKQWLAAHQQWLLILDNADDVTVVQDMAPPERSGHLLLTTRAQALGALAQRIEVETMGMAEGTLFLLRRAKLLAPDAPLDHTAEEHMIGAEAIVIEMDFLPLAVDQAGAYIEEVGCSLASYLELYRTYRADLLRRRGHVATEHPESVATTWSLNFRQVERANPAAADLLRLCAFLEPDAIPEELICEGNAFLGPVLERAAADALLFNAAIEELRKFSLVQRDPETRLLRVHRLVQAVLKDAMEEDAQRQWAERAVRATNTAFPERVEQATWIRCRHFLPQAQMCSMLIQDYAFLFEEAASLLFRTASYLRDTALYEQAELLFQQALQIWEHTLGSEHSNVASGLAGLADLYLELGKYEQAEPLFVRSLLMREHLLGPEHPHIAENLSGLAILYCDQGKYEQAEPLFARSLLMREHLLGPDHLHVAESLNSLANLYWNQGKYEQAEPLYLRALAIREQQLGPDHLLTAYNLGNLANLYRGQGKYKQAEPLFARALSIYERQLGSNHPHTATGLNNLAGIYRDQGKYEQAKPLYLRALVIREQQLGPNHPFTAQSLNNLATLYLEQGKYEQAEPLYLRALAIREQQLGPDHPHTAQSLNNLATLYRDQGKYAEARPLYQRALHICEQHLGPDHPITVTTQRDYAAFLQMRERNTETAATEAHFQR